MLNKDNIMDIIQSHKDEINEISSELIKAKAWGLIGTTDEQIIGEYDA